MKKLTAAAIAAAAAAAPFVNGGILRGRRWVGRSVGQPQWEFVDCRIRRGKRSRGVLSLCQQRITLELGKIIEIFHINFFFLLLEYGARGL